MRGECGRGPDAAWKDMKDMGKDHCSCVVDEKAGKGKTSWHGIRWHGMGMGMECHVDT
jgi:hypothetical protein